MSKLTRAERYKRNYALIRNTYNDSDLAKEARTWGAKRLYKELGISTPEYSKQVKLKPISNNTSYYKRKLKNFKDATQNRGLDPRVARRIAYKSHYDLRIKNNERYREALERPFDYEERESRRELWKDFSRKGDKIGFPPDLEQKAIEYNQQQGFDNYDSYGFAFAFYEFMENSSAIAKEVVKPDKYELNKYVNSRRKVNKFS